MVWIGANLSTTVLAASAALIGTFNAAALALRSFTIVRFRFLLHTISDQAAVSEDPRGVVGAMVVNDQASAIGITAIPSPVANSDAPWFLYDAYSVSFIFLSSVGIDGQSGTQVIIDLKAMRKVGINEDLAIVSENVDSAGGAVHAMIGRMLVKFH